MFISPKIGINSVNLARAKGVNRPVETHMR